MPGYRAGVVKLGDSVPAADVRLGQQGDQLISSLHADYYEQAVRKNLFFSHSIARATSLPATAMIGNILWNPPDSGVNLALVKWASSVHVTSATCTGILLAAGYSASAPTTTTVADNSGSTFLNLSGATNNIFVKGKVQAYALATFLIAPVAVCLLHHNTAAIATTGVDGMFDEPKGIWVVPPGGFLCVAAQGAAAAAASHTSTLVWEEVPVL